MYLFRAHDGPILGHCGLMMGRFLGHVWTHDGSMPLMGPFRAHPPTHTPTHTHSHTHTRPHTHTHTHTLTRPTNCNLRFQGHTARAQAVRFRSSQLHSFKATMLEATQLEPARANYTFKFNTTMPLVFPLELAQAKCTSNFWPSSDPCWIPLSPMCGPFWDPKVQRISGPYLTQDGPTRVRGGPRRRLFFWVLGTS
jgi:hypothetical protein